MAQWMIRNRKSGKFATDTRGLQPLIVCTWGKRGDAEMLTQDEHDTASLAPNWEWIQQGQRIEENR